MTRNQLTLGVIGSGLVLLLLAAGHWNSGKVKSIVELAEAELKRWEDLNEDMSSAFPILKKYWKATGINYPGNKTHWSAAFISWLANKHDPGSLPGSGSHMLYAGKAKSGEGRYKVLRPNTTIQPGDIILRNRQGGKLTYEHIGRGHAASHADIVTKVDGNEARAIGGNKLGDTVGVEYYPLSNGVLTDSRAFAILRKS